MNDEFQIVAKEIPLVKKLIDTGYTGRKGKGGFYRMNKNDNQKVLEAINFLLVKKRRHGQIWLDRQF